LGLEKKCKNSEKNQMNDLFLREILNSVSIEVDQSLDLNDRFVNKNIKAIKNRPIVRVFFVFATGKFLALVFLKGGAMKNYSYFFPSVC
jgi:hypothetical protein